MILNGVLYKDFLLKHHELNKTVSNVISDYLKENNCAKEYDKIVMSLLFYLYNLLDMVKKKLESEEK